jgi:hypothetical protein
MGDTLKTIGNVLGTVAPWLNAGLTGGPVGVGMLAVSKIAGALGLSGNQTPDTLKAALSNMSLTPDQELALEKADNDFELQMTQAGYQNIQALTKMDIDQLAIVNATMIKELENADKETWYQKGWRPFCGFAVAAGSFVGVMACAVLFFKAIMDKDPTALTAIPGLATSMAMILSVPGAAVGIAAWHRGVAQVQEVKNAGKDN